jgi:hypothetical protein
VHYLTERITLLAEMATGRVSAPCVVVLAIDALECSSLVYWNRTRAVLIFLVGIIYCCTKSTEAVRLARTKWRIWLWSGQFVVPDETLIMG